MNTHNITKEIQYTHQPSKTVFVKKKHYYERICTESVLLELIYTNP